MKRRRMLVPSPGEPSPEKKSDLGNRARGVADRLRQETDLQIKTTSRILGAAAQISENHDRLIQEVADMVMEDLGQGNQTTQSPPQTVDSLKQQFKTLQQAKSHFGITARSWATLADKLNNSCQQPNDQQPSDRTSPDQKASVSQRLDALEREMQTLRQEVTKILTLLEQLTLSQQ